MTERASIDFTSTIEEREQLRNLWGECELPAGMKIPLKIIIAKSFTEHVMLDYYLDSDYNGGPQFIDAIQQYARSDQLGITDYSTGLYVFRGHVTRVVFYNYHLQTNRFVFEGDVSKEWSMS